MSSKSYITRRDAVKVAGLVTAGALAFPRTAEAQGASALGRLLDAYADALKSEGVTVGKSVRRKGYKLKDGSWKPVRYKIEYRTFGGSVPGGCPASYTIETPTFALGEARKRSYAFRGWYTCGDEPKPVKRIKKGSTGDRTLQAVWDVPSYWRSHIADRCEKVNADIGACTGGYECFVFLTDVHEKTNAMHAPVLIHNIMLGTPVCRVVFGGDVINWYPSPSKAISRMRSFKESMSFADEFHYVRGNHDANQEDSRAKRSQRLTDAQIRAVFENGAMRENAPAEDALYYFHDNVAGKTRYLFLDTGPYEGASMSSAQLAWARERIMELEKGWSVIVFQHMLFRESGYSKSKDRHKLGIKGKQVNGVLIHDLLDDVSRRCAATVIGVFCGHAHLDYAARSAAGYWMIMTTTDAYRIANKLPEAKRYGRHRRNAGTTSEQSFDVVVVDKAARKIKMTRVGAGSDREFSY